jgi:hypothetical protein
MSQHNPHGGLFFLLQQLEECGHEVAHCLHVRRRVHRAPDIHLAIAIAREVSRLHKACRHARAEQLPVPLGMIAVGDSPGVGPGQDVLDARFHGLESLPVAARGQRIALVPVALVRLGG